MGVGTSAAIIPAAIGAAGSVGGALIGQGQAGQQKELNKQQVLTEEDQRNLMDTYARLQQEYGQDAANFYLSYMTKGNPFITSLLSQHFGQIAKQFGNQQGLLGQRLAAGGFGAAPSGLAAASMGDLSRSEANTQSESWLNDMMQNEQLKFNAAQGLGGIANMFQPGQFALHRFSNPQVPQSPWTQVPGAIGTGLQGLSGALNGLGGYNTTGTINPIGMGPTAPSGTPGPFPMGNIPGATPPILPTNPFSPGGVTP